MEEDVVLVTESVGLSGEGADFVVGSFQRAGAEGVVEK